MRHPTAKSAAGCSRDAPTGVLRRVPKEGISATALHKAATRITVQDATDAWFDGAFERCLELCDAVRARDAATRVHVGLLRARALLRLGRASDATAALADVASIPCGTDEAITLRMLAGAARVRAGEFEDGLRELLSARSNAASAHPAIRSEIALNIALAHMGRRDFTAAERALNAVAPDTDIIAARALEYRGWIAQSRSDEERATSMFLGALEAYDACRHRDRFLEANCVRVLAHLALDRLDLETWTIVAARVRRIDWSENGLADPRFWATYCAAGFAMDVHGDARRAAREARIAEQIAPTEAYRAQALCKRASIAFDAGETLSGSDHLEYAAEICGALQQRDFTRDHQSAALLLAMELVRTNDVERAMAAIRFARAALETSPPQPVDGLPVNRAFRHMAEATVFEAAGDNAAAVQAYQDAFRIYSGVGYTRRSAAIALTLARLTGERKMLAYADRVTSHLPAKSLLRQRVEAALRREPQLTDVQREVLVLICQGKSNPEIARLRKRSLHTIRNLVARLFEVLDVKSREELAVEGVRRGVYTPERRSIAS
jgi:DNA-binding CsgD family transcriptional regulator